MSQCFALAHTMEADMKPFIDQVSRRSRELTEQSVLQVFGPGHLFQFLDFHSFFDLEAHRECLHGESQLDDGDSPERKKSTGFASAFLDLVQ